MNLQQFFNETLSNNGASYSILTGELNPTNGYFVSLANKGVTVDLNNFTQKDIVVFISENYDTLSQENHFIGSWISEGIVYLDVTVQVTDKRNALELGYRNGQQAIYDANVGKVIDLPSPQRAGTYTQQKAYLTQVIDNLTK